MVPSTDASKQNTSEATFPLMSKGTVKKMGTKIAHFELLHTFSLQNGHRVCGTS